MTRKHGSQLVDEDDIGKPGFDEAYEEAGKALGTPLVLECYEALEKVALKHGLVLTWQPPCPSRSRRAGRVGERAGSRPCGGACRSWSFVSIAREPASRAPLR